MPEHRSENAIIPDGIIPGGEAVPEMAHEGTAPAENAWVEFERGRLSRRQALKKLGMTSAMATFALFSVDDLARMVGKAMQQRAGDNKVAAQIAHELQSAGIAEAGSPCGCLASCGCGGCTTAYDLHICGCDSAYTDCAGPLPPGCGNGLGVFNPVCIAYNINLIANCKPQKNSCYLVVNPD